MLNFLGALGFLSRIRVPDRALARDLNSTAHYFPLVGILIGSIGAAVFTVAHLILPVMPAVILSMCATALATGGFHEDGLSDSADGLGGGWTKEDVLRIMQDSRVGSFGALALILVLFLKAETLAAIPDGSIAHAMIAGHGLSRLVAVSFTFTHKYVRFEGKSKPLSDGITLRQLLFAALTAWIPVMFFDWQIAVMALVALAAVRTYIGYRINIRIGGYTGDLLGLSQQISEVTFYLVVCAWMFTS